MPPLRPLLACLAVLALALPGAATTTTSGSSTTAPPSTTSYSWSSSMTGTSSTTATPTTSTWISDPPWPLAPTASFFTDPSLPAPLGYSVAAGRGHVAAGLGSNSSAELRLELYGSPYGTWERLDTVLVPHKTTFLGDRVAVDLRGDFLLAGFSGPGLEGQARLYDVATGHLEPIVGLTGGPAEARHAFGAAVALGDGWAAVGAPGSDGAPGSVYIFQPDASGTWALTLALHDTGGASGFGSALAAGEGTTLFVAGASEGTARDGVAVLDPVTGKLATVLRAPATATFGTDLSASKGRLEVAGTAASLEDGKPPMAAAFHYRLDSVHGWTLMSATHYTSGEREADSHTHSEVTYHAETVAVASAGKDYAVSLDAGYLQVVQDGEASKWDLSPFGPAVPFDVAFDGDVLAAAGARNPLGGPLPVHIWSLSGPDCVDCEVPRPACAMPVPVETVVRESWTTTSSPTPSPTTTTSTSVFTTGPTTSMDTTRPAYADTTTARPGLVSPFDCSVGCADDGDCAFCPHFGLPAKDDWASSALDPNATRDDSLVLREEPTPAFFSGCAVAMRLPSAPTPVAGRATPRRPLRVELPDAVGLLYEVAANARVKAEATVTLDPAALPVPVPELPSAAKYLHVEPLADVPSLEAVTIEMGLDGLPADVAATMSVHFWNGTAWVDLAADEDGIVPAATPEGELHVLAAGRDLARGVAWAKVSHTSTYALAPGAGPAGDLTVDHKQTDWAFAWIVGASAALAVAAVVGTAVVLVRRRLQ